jgi:hypothetical protein
MVELFYFHILFISLMPNLAKLSYMDDHHFNYILKKRKKIAPFFRTPPPQSFLQKENKYKEKKDKDTSVTISGPCFYTNTRWALRLISH